MRKVCWYLVGCVTPGFYCSIIVMCWDKGVTGAFAEGCVGRCVAGCVAGCVRVCWDRESEINVASR